LRASQFRKAVGPIRRSAESAIAGWWARATIVDYELPLRSLGVAARRLLVGHALNHIFDYRRAATIEMFAVKTQVVTGRKTKA